MRCMGLRWKSLKVHSARSLSWWDEALKARNVCRIILVDSIGVYFIMLDYPDEGVIKGMIASHKDQTFVSYVGRLMHFIVPYLGVTEKWMTGFRWKSLLVFERWNWMGLMSHPCLCPVEDWAFWYNEIVDAGFSDAVILWWDLDTRRLGYLVVYISIR